MADTIRHDTTKRHRDKYENKNLVHRLVLGRFLDALAEELKPFQDVETLDFGCGEAFFWEEMKARGVEMSRLTGIDLREDALDVARHHFPQHEFLCQDLLEWKTSRKFGLVVASQVLEHLPDPARFLSRLVELTEAKGSLLLTVPWEPFFMLSNLARGRDVRRFGNHPEHVNLWSKRGFRKFVELHADVSKSESVIPFTTIIARPRNLATEKPQVGR